MSIIDFEEEEKKRKVEYPRFRLVQGGKEPPKIFGEYWLKDLEEHAVFIANRKVGEDSWIASEYHIIVKIGDAYQLMLRQYDPEKRIERVHYTWVNGPGFCMAWNCVEVLDDGKSYRTYFKDGLEGDERVHTDSEMDQDTGQEVVSGKSENEPVDTK